jgi:hypothetical protein
MISAAEVRLEGRVSAILSRFRRTDPFAVGAFLLPLVVYLTTRAPSVFWVDSGIYLAAAKEPGVAYAPGFPLYVLGAFVFGKVPIGSFAMRVHALSSLAGALTCLVLYLSVLRLADDPKAGPVRTRAAAFLASLGFGFSFLFWAQAVNAEVYALQTLLASVVLALMIRIERTPGEPARADFLWLALAAGIGFANHPMTVALLPVIGGFLYRHRTRWRFWLPGAPVFLLAGILPYAYMPLASAANPLADWGNVETAGNFLRFVTASQWTGEASSFSFLGGPFWDNAGVGLVLLFTHFYPAGLLLAAIGAARIFRSRRSVFWILSATSLLSVALPLVYVGTREFGSWFLPAFYVLALCAGSGCLRVLQWVRGPGRGPWLAGGMLCLAALLYPGLLFTLNLPGADRSDDWDAHDWGINLLRGVEDGGILLVSGDNPSSTVLYAQAVLDERPDVACINQEGLDAKWYRDYVRTNLGVAFRDPDVWPGTARGRITAVVRAIRRENPQRPLYSLMPLRLSLPGSLKLVPSGVVYRIAGKEVRPPLQCWDFTFHPSSSLGEAVPKDPRIAVTEARHEMRAGYLRAFRTGGEYLFDRGAVSRAEQLFAAAVRLSPEDESLRLWHAVSLAKLGRTREARDACRELVEKLPASFRGYYNLGQMCLTLGDREGARHAFLMALEIEPGFDLAASALGDLDQKSRDR